MALDIQLAFFFLLPKKINQNISSVILFTFNTDYSDTKVEARVEAIFKSMPFKG
jgi:hypothetical protein